MENTKELSGMDALQFLEDMKEEIEAPTVIDPKPLELPVSLPGGWRFCDWKQKHMLALTDKGLFSPDKTWDSDIRMNQEIAAAAIEVGCFELPTAVSVDMLDGLEWRDVEQIRTAVVNQYLNKRRIPKN